MNDLIAVPTVEQINLEHQLANSKASEAVQHALNCGLMLSQVKASLNHGEWLPWLKQQQESGAISFTERTASKYMRVASNRNRGSDLVEAPSIRAALELLSDKESEEQQGELIDVEAERRAREAAEAKAEAERQARELFERRAQESQTESNERRKKIRELEAQIGLLESRKEPEPVKIEVPPADYEIAKAKAEELERELAKIKKEQATLVNSQVKAKLHEYQSEVDEMEQRKTLLQEQVDRMKSYMASLESDAKRAEVHQSVINGVRLELINLAAFLSDEEPIQDADTLKRWRGLSAMLSEATTAIHQYAGDAKPALTVIAGGAA